MLFLFSLAPGDEETVNQLFQENHRLMYNVAMRILHKSDLAEEAVQDAFVNIVANLQRIHSIPCPQRVAFCVVIVKNAAINIIRRQKRVIYLEDLDYVPDEESEDAERLFFRAEETGELLRHMEALPSDDRLLLQMKWGKGMNYKRIAELLGISEEAAKKRGQRAVARLRNQYEGGLVARGESR